MTDEEKGLILRAINGDVDAINDIYPDVDPELMAKYQKFLEAADDASIMWFGYIAFFVGKNVSKSRKENCEQSKRLADAWNECISNIENKQNEEKVNNRTP